MFHVQTCGTYGGVECPRFLCRVRVPDHRPSQVEVELGKAEKGYLKEMQQAGLCQQANSACEYGLVSTLQCAGYLHRWLIKLGLLEFEEAHV